MTVRKLAFIVAALVVAGMISVFVAPLPVVSQGSGPTIHQASVSPDKVQPGMVMVVSAEVSDPSGIESVTADMGGIETISLSLIQGSIYHGDWQGQWLVHDTGPREYTTIIVATNFRDVTSSYSITWTDQTWDSYSDSKRNKVWGQPPDVYDANYPTVYMYGTGYTSNSYYDIYYYDGANDLVTAATEINVLTTAAGKLEGSYLLDTDPAAAEGWWNCGVLGNPSTPPSTWQTTGWVAYDVDGFYVESSAIPEFPTVFAAIAVVALCAMVYFLTRRKMIRVKA